MLRSGLFACVLSALAVACGGDDDAALPAAAGSGAGGSGATSGSGAIGTGAAVGMGATGGSVGGNGGDGGVGGVSGAGMGGTAGSAGSGGGAACGLPPVAPGGSDLLMESSGLMRKARILTPTAYDGSTMLPLIVVFHGYLENASAIENISQMTPIAEREGYLLAYPEGISTAWNAGKCCGSGASEQRPDVQFVRDLLDEISSKWCVDQKRIYAAGFSNGGMLSNRLACEVTDRFAAIAPVAGPRAMDTCAPSRFIPVIQFHGTSDFVVPYNGGGLGGAISLAENTAFWSSANGCMGPEQQVYQQGDSTCVELSCAGGTAVRTCTVDGGGHQWPGGNSAGPAGKLTKDITASEEMVTFFKKYSLP